MFRNLNFMLRALALHPWVTFADFDNLPEA
ncbi:hypothetical protein METEAL_14950 [Mesoterricola silvestris]|uniref:Uncharacterized protein n=1 Tax=Mesoterricola silvestris TaxID=2927979 RepID=A0AA48K8I2_9BACT|nr:hypothetical protein METEAL_14950 [Mesoterricola silvestris]